MNIMLKFSQLNSLIGDIFSGIGNFFTNIVSAILGWLFIILYNVFVTSFFLAMDAVQVLFRKFAGLDVYVVEGETKSGDIILTLINNQTVQNVFWSLLILAVVLLIITTVVALIKAQTQASGDKDKKTNNQIFVSAVKALVNFFMVPVVAILGIFMGNALLKSLDQATSGGANMRLSSIVFTACAYDSNRARKSADFAAEVASGKNAFGVLNGDVDKVADRIDEAFKNYTKFETAKFERVDDGNLFADPDGTYGFVSTIRLYSLEKFYNTERSSFSIYDIYQVWYYYDLTAFNYLFALIASIFICWVLLSASVGLIKRMFKVTILLCISPVIASMMPLDNGNALKSWRQNFIGSVLSAYATIVVLNLTFVVLGPINQIDFFYGNVLQAGINQAAQLIIICGAMFFFKDLTEELSKMIGAENAYSQGTKATPELAAKIAKGAGIATAGIAGIRAAKMANKAMKAGNTEAAEIYQDKAKAQLGMAKNRFSSLATNGISDKIGKENDELNKKFDYKKKNKAVAELKKNGTEKAIKKEYNKNTTVAQRLLRDSSLGLLGGAIINKGASAVKGVANGAMNVADTAKSVATNNFVAKKIGKAVEHSKQVKDLATSMNLKDLNSLNKGYAKQLKNKDLTKEERKQIKHDQKLTQSAIESRREENASKKAARESTKKVPFLKSQAIYLKAAVDSVFSKDKKFKSKPSKKS